ncbi:hypothetical protein [Listeria sp. ILCC792]|uniref:hypothetical protein n=1 Tax=Listeria sp. ILCC792 TaxID=1918331 RepID=UPI000B58D849|nr:hypothetical protein [Listeria sp. ILCC792]
MVFTIALHRTNLTELEKAIEDNKKRGFVQKGPIRLLNEGGRTYVKDRAFFKETGYFANEKFAVQMIKEVDK